MRRLAGLLLVGGTAAAVLGLSKIHASVVAGSEGYDFTSSFRFPWALTFLVLLVIAAYVAGLPDEPRGIRQIAASTISAPLLGVAGVSVLQLVVGSALLPRFVVVGTVAILVPWYVLCALVSHSGRSLALDRDRVVVVGSTEDGRELVAELARGAEQPARIVAVMTPEDATPAPGRPTPIGKVVDEHMATVVVLDRSAQAVQLVVDQVALLHEDGVRVRTLSLFYEEWLGKLPVAELERMSLLFDIGEVHRRRYARQRRILDVCLAAVGVVALAAMLPVVLVGNLVANRGPLLFRQERVGQGGRRFTILKFRTMRADDGDTLSWTTDDDPRITRFGRFLRRSHLDELPQVINVLAGDLAIVGPRPEQPHYVEELAAKLPFYNVRHLVRPGLTGWAQVKYGYAGHEHDALEKLQFEFYYLRHQGLGLDTRIVARTARSIFRRRGR